eukprot:TRINITY_DN4649_c0_g1_i3.p1 TRINITY_DN4649_c0_g1~~TRINITY_DN4649_c0_g1_i3.p1  ORF type:complete len:199 (+),score=47.75 TRINITY_DN4649_c0_g1_i3:893-1489(+)
MDDHYKDFSKVQRTVQTKTLSEVIHFYYLWKVTERYEIWKSEESLPSSPISSNEQSCEDDEDSVSQVSSPGLPLSPSSESDSDTIEDDTDLEPPSKKRKIETFEKNESDTSPHFCLEDFAMQFPDTLTQPKAAPPTETLEYQFPPPTINFSYSEAIPPLPFDEGQRICYSVLPFEGSLDPYDLKTEQQILTMYGDIFP